MNIKKTVTFIKPAQVENHLGEITFEAAEGETMDLVATSANRWIRRGIAIEGKAAPKQPAQDADGPAEATKAENKSAPKKKSTPKKQAS